MFSWKPQLLYRVGRSLNQRLRIAHVTATFPPYQGGTGNVCFNQARELARLGHEVHVFTASVSGAPQDEELEGIAVHRLRPLVQVGNAPVLPGLLWRLRGFDLIHLHYPFILGAEMVRLSALINRIPLLLSFHNDLIGVGSREKAFAVYQQLSAQVTVRGADRLCAVSLDHFRSSRLSQTLSDAQTKLIEVANGVDLDHFRPLDKSTELRDKFGIPHDAPLALFVAALDRAHHFKGLDTLLEALLNTPDNTWLLVAGDGDMRDAFEQQAARLGLTPRVRFAGLVTQQELPLYYNAADVTVLPSTPPESFGLVLIESLACGAPVIASNIPGVRTVVAHGVDGLLVQPNDPAALALAIKDVLADNNRRVEMGKQGRARVKESYSWPMLGRQLDSLYRQVLLDTATTKAPAIPVAEGNAKT